MDEEPIVCRKGFHACLNPYDVLDYYANNGKNRYFLVNLGGSITDCDYDDTKVASNEITFLKEVSVNDFPALFDEFLKDKERLAKLKYKDGFARVKKDYKYNFIDKEGNYLCEDWFDAAYTFSYGFALVNKKGKWNFIDKDGNILCEDWFEYVGDFKEGFAIVEKGGKYNFIKKDGKYLSKEWFDDAWSFSDGIAQVSKNSKWYRLYPDEHLEVD